MKKTTESVEVPAISIENPTKAIFAAVCNIMAEISPIKKGKTAPAAAGGFSFRGIDDVFNALHSLFAQNSVFVTTKVLRIEQEDRANMVFTHLTLEVSLNALDGSSISTQSVGIGSDRLDKSASKAISQAIKHALCDMFLIPTQEDTEQEIAQYAQPREYAKPMPKEPELPKHILDSLTECTTLAELEAFWNQHANQHTSSKFKAAVTELKKIILSRENSKKD